ncbi:ester cyclase, partial [Halobacteriales archaeon QS_1_67_19]
VVVRYTMTGTQQGEFKGIPPTGEDVEIAGIAIYRVDDGTITEAWVVSDFLRAMKQIGVVE